MPPKRGQPGGDNLILFKLDNSKPESYTEQLREALAKDFVRVIDLFKDWDDDENGMVSKTEFRKALPMLGIKVDRNVAEKLFDSFDNDKSGEIDYKELNYHLRGGADIELDAALRDGAAGEIVLQAKNAIATRGALTQKQLEEATALQGVKLEMGDAASVGEQLCRALDKNWMRIIDLFREWDDDGSGSVSKVEFRRALPCLGLRVDKADANALFDSFDADNSGSVDFKELHRAIKRRTLKPVARMTPRGPLVLRQPAEEKGSYQSREWQIPVSDALAKATFTIKDMVVRGKKDEHPLMWGAHSYVGRIFLPKGVVAVLYSEISHMVKGKKPHSTLVGNDAEIDFWDFDHRVMAFRFEAAPVAQSPRRTPRRPLPKDDDLESIPPQELKGNWKQAMQDEAEARKRLLKLQRDYEKALQAQSRDQHREERRAGVAAVRADMARRVGSDVTDKLMDVERASQEEVRLLSVRFNIRMLDILLPHEQEWYMLFKAVDYDRSGRISYEEFESMMRGPLKMTLKKLPAAKLSALWKALDEDDSGWLSCGEFGRFMKLGAQQAADHVAQRVAAAKAAKAEEARAVKEETDKLTGRDVTDKLAELPSATEEQVAAFSQDFNQRMASIMLPQELELGGWYRVFKAVDTDKSGRISISEFTDIVRNTFKIPAAKLPAAELNGLWKALDDDSSGWLSCGEFGRFMKLGAPQAASSNARADPEAQARRLQEKREKARAGRILAAQKEEATQLLLMTQQAEDQKRAMEAEAARLEAALAETGKPRRVIVVCRNSRDAAVSLLHHTRDIPPFAFVGGWDEFAPLFLAGNVESSSFWAWHEGWFRAAQAQPETVLWVSFEDMKSDLAGVARRVAAFLGLNRSAAELEAVAARCGFDAMKTEQTRRDVAAVASGGYVKKGHMREGGVGGWHAILRPEDVAAFEARDDALEAACGLSLHGRDGVLV